jgi:glycosyltransferase involved in cell wall biosynthesis
MVHDLSGRPAIPADLLAILPDRGDALLITRQNLALADALRQVKPALTWTVFSKSDMTGRGARWLLGRLRARRWTMVVLEDGAAEAERRLDLYRAMLLAARARSRVLVSGEPPVVRWVSWARDALPLTGSLVLETFATLRALAQAAWLLATVRPRAPRPIPSGSTLAYLRTDFWFGVRAGGSVSHIGGFLRGARTLGYEATVVTSDPLANLPEATREIVIAPPARPRLVEEAALIGFNRAFAAGAVSALRAHPPDILVHRHSVFSLAGVIVARALDRPLVLEVNSSEVWVRRAWSRLQLEGLAAGLERRAFAAADRITVVSAVLARQLAEMGVAPDKIVVNPNGVAIERFDPSARGENVRGRLAIPSNAIVVGFLGTFTRWHGVLFLAEQVRAMLDADPRLVFLFIGDGDLRGAVEARIESAGAGARCRFTGLVAPDEIPTHLAACDILVSPHLPFEDGTEFFGSPTKLFEYMAAGRSVAASRLGQIGEIVRDGESGLLFAPGDATALRSTVLRLAADPALRDRLGRAARGVVEREYTWTDNARRALGAAHIASTGYSGAE